MLDTMTGTSRNPEYVFECVFDAPSLTEALEPTNDGDAMLERWLNEPSIRVVVPQLSTLFHTARPRKILTVLR